MSGRGVQLDFAAQLFVEAEVLQAAAALPSGRAYVEENMARQRLKDLGYDYAADTLEVRWNPRLSSTAGVCFARQYLICLNPRLVRVSREEVERTLLHELAHLLAALRKGRRRIRSHGPEWKQACADLGIAGEERCHELPLPRRTVKRHYFYQCPQCGVKVERVRSFKRREACMLCCRKYNKGRYAERYRFIACEAGG